MALSQLFDLFSRKMEYLTQRQGVIAENIANVNTPDYKAKDLESFDKIFKQISGGNAVAASGFYMASTNTKHIIPASAAGNAYKVQKDKDPYEVKPGGNAVSIEQQMTELAGANADYQMITGLYRKTLSLLKTALGRAS